MLVMRLFIVFAWYFQQRDLNYGDKHGENVVNGVLRIWVLVKRKLRNGYIHLNLISTIKRREERGCSLWYYEVEMSKQLEPLLETYNQLVICPSITMLNQWLQYPPIEKSAEELCHLTSRVIRVFDDLT